MENNNLFSGEKRKGFTIVEMAIVILILGIMASVMTFSPEIAKQTAKREAERLQMFLSSMEDAADRRHMNFDIEVGPILETGQVVVTISWGDKYPKSKLEPTVGCSYENKLANKKGTYNARNKRFNAGGTITVIGADGECDVIIATTEGRIRISETRQRSR